MRMRETLHAGFHDHRRLAAHQRAEPIGDLVYLRISEAVRQPALEFNVANEAMEQAISADSVHAAL